MSNRIVVVTGATGGLGPSVTARFQSSGDTVVGVARKGADVSADLTDPAAARSAIEEVLRRHGSIDVLVHVMGGFAADGDLQATTDETWRRMIDMNLMSAVYVLRGVVPGMKAAGHGRAIAVGSKAGVEPGAGISAYAASKAALHALVQSAALEIKGSGATVNAVLPSTIRTPANAVWATPEQMVSFTDPASIAEVVFFVASDAASDINGALIPVYGR